MAAIAVPYEVCEEEGKMAPHFVVRSSALRVTQSTLPASISAATEGYVYGGLSFPGRDSERAFFPARLCRPSVSAFPSLFPVHSAGRERAVGVRNQDTEPCLTMACAGATTTRDVRAKRTARRVIHPGLPCSHLW